MTDHNGESAAPAPTEAPDRSISVAMATYNGARYVTAQIESIAGQTVLPAELVVSDDGSTDDTVAIIRQLQASCPFPIRMLPHEGKLGFADNFLKAAGGCRSRYIAFCDQDDVWLPNKLERMLKRLTGDRSILALHRSTLTDQDLNPTGTLAQDIVDDRVHDPLTLDPYITGWGNTMMFDRQVLEYIDRNDRPAQPEYPDRRLSHDHWVYTISAAIGRVSHITDCLCLYRQHGGNAFGMVTRSLSNRLRAAMTVPLYRFREREAFCRAMSALFNEAASNPSFGEIDFAAASEAYAGRARAMSSRIGVYTAASPIRRIRMLRRYAHEQGRDPAEPGSRLSTAKDVILGVAKLGRIETGKS